MEFLGYLPLVICCIFHLRMLKGDEGKGVSDGVQGTEQERLKLRREGTGRRGHQRTDHRYYQDLGQHRLDPPISAVWYLLK